MCQSTNSMRQEVSTNSYDKIGCFEDHIIEIIRNLTKNTEIEGYNILTEENAHFAINKVNALIEQIKRSKLILKQINAQIS